MGLFRHKKKLPGAEVAWDESRQVDMGDMVAVPADQLPREALERPAGVQLYPGSDDQPGPFVMVNISAAKRDALPRTEELADCYAPLIARESSSRRVAKLEAEWQAANEQATLDAFNDNWVNGGAGGLPDEGTGEKYTLMRVNILTGRIGDE